MKADTITQVDWQPGGSLVAQVDRLPGRRLCCGECGHPAPKVAATRRPERRWQDLSVREQPLWLVYAPSRVWCPTCGLRVERVPWAAKWQRVTHALARAVEILARKLDWPSVAAHFRENWKTVASVVEATVLWGLAHRRWLPLHIVGIDEVSRRKGQQDLTLVYDLARCRVVWIGKDRDGATLQRFFGWLSRRRARATRVVCCDMWRAYLATLRQAVPLATALFDRFHLTRYATDAVDTVYRPMWRQLAEAERPNFKR
jgi:transposase